MPILHILIKFQNVASNDETLFFYIAFLKFHFRDFIKLRKTRPLFLHPNRRRILPIFTVNYPKNCMNNLRLNSVKKNDVKLS